MLGADKGSHRRHPDKQAGMPRRIPTPFIVPRLFDLSTGFWRNLFDCGGADALDQCKVEDVRGPGSTTDGNCFDIVPDTLYTNLITLIAINAGMTELLNHPYLFVGNSVRQTEWSTCIYAR